MSQIKMKRITVSDVYNNTFYQLPKFILEGRFKNLSNDARVLYSLLKERHKLSLENKWFNENGEVYLIYTRKNMQSILGKSDKTVKKIVNELINIGLIEEERIGLTKANRIYLNAVSLEKSLIRSDSDSGDGRNPILESEKVRTNKKNYNKKNYNNNIAQRNFKEREYPDDYYDRFYENNSI